MNNLYSNLSIKEQITANTEGVILKHLLNSETSNKLRRIVLEKLHPDFFYIREFSRLFKLAKYLESKGIECNNLKLISDSEIFNKDDLEFFMWIYTQLSIRVLDRFLDDDDVNEYLHKFKQQYYHRIYEEKISKINDNADITINQKLLLIHELTSEISDKLKIPDVNKDLKIIEAEMDEVWNSIRNEIPPPEVIVSIDGKPLIIKNGLTIISGAKGSYKSKLSESIIISLLRDFDAINPLSIKKQEEVFVGLIDTERSRSGDFARALQLIAVQTTGERVKPSNLYAASTISIARPNRFDVIKSIVLKLQETVFNKHIVLFLDVVSDLVSDFNSVVESMQLTEFINQLINNQNISVVALIHENPNSNKARGHLGTELVNKASIVLSMDAKNKQINWKHIRSFAQPSSVRFNWVGNGLEVIESNSTIPEEISKETKIASYCKALIDRLNLGTQKFLSKRSIRDEICDLLKISDARYYIGRIEDYLLKHGCKTSSGKNQDTLYSLEEYDMMNSQ